MQKYSRTQNIVDGLCRKLHCLELADDLEKINHAREKLAQLQQAEVFKRLSSDAETLSRTHMTPSYKISNMILKTKQRLDSVKTSFSNIDVSKSEKSVRNPEESKLPDEECDMECNKLDDDPWLGFFRGYEILEVNQERIVNENKQCIELSLKHDNIALENYLRRGIRCFMIDLFVGTELEKQKVIFKLRESELKISREFGFPVTTTLFAMLSPRLQFTGIMDDKYPMEKLKKGHSLTLTVKTKYSSRCTANKVYVNAAFLIEDCRKDDFILVGPSIQLVVTEVLEEELKCVVMEPGILCSRLPVRFPARCWRLQISLEELENMTFAREVGIKTLVSYRPGNEEYLSGLKDAMHLLKCDNLRLFTRLVLNEYKGEQNSDLERIANNYEGFLVDFSIEQSDQRCQEEYSAKVPFILKLSPASENFMKTVYSMKKPIVLNPCLIAESKLLVQPSNIAHIFYYPDKFMFCRKNYNHCLSFYRLQKAMSEKISLLELSNRLFCDPSDLSDDTIARACVAASFQCQAKAIIVCSAWPDMSIKISHFRPTAPIFHVSEIKSIGDYISLYHHVIFMNLQIKTEHNYVQYVQNALIFCMIYLRMRNILLDGENVMLVYGSEPATKLCDRYLVYKFDKKHFAKNLHDILFV